jgi:hypothetical protein
VVGCPGGRTAAAVDGERRRKNVGRGGVLRGQGEAVSHSAGEGHREGRKEVVKLTVMPN